MNTQIGGGPASVPAVLFQGAENQLFFTILHRSGQAGGGRKGCFGQSRQSRGQRRIFQRKGQQIEAVEGDISVEHVLKLPHIAGPMMGQGRVQDPAGNQRQPVLIFMPPHKMIDQQGDILFPLPQGRQMNGDDVDPIKKILAHPALPHQSGQVLVGGGDDADAGLAHALPAHRQVTLAFDHPQQLHLHVMPDLPQFVQEKGAAVGQVQVAVLVLVSAGKGPLAVAEKLAFQQALRNGAAVDNDKGPRRPSAHVMDRPGHQFLARAGFAVDDDVGVRGRGA